MYADYLKKIQREFIHTKKLIYKFWYGLLQKSL